MSPETLAAIAGGAVPNLEPGTLQMLRTMGWKKLQISTTPNGISIMANDNQPFPSLAYDPASLQRLVDLPKPMLQSTPDTLATLEQVLRYCPIRI